MDEIRGLSNRILEIDLSIKKWNIFTVPEEDTRLYMGGKGMVIKMLYDRLEAGTDPLGAGNIIAFHTGAFLGTGAPCSGKFSAGAKSPLTGIIATSSCGGPFGMALRTSGWDGMIIRGKSDKLIWMMVSSTGVEFNDASLMAGMETDRVQSELETKGSGMIAIGPAGEKRVGIANIASGDRFLGRAGLGAVMGSKNIKAIVAKGKESRIVPHNREAFKKIRAAFLDDNNRNGFTGKFYREYGTNSYLRLSQKNGMLPVNNFSDGSHPDFDKISGETFARDHISGYSTCKPCVILCGHRGNFGGESLQVPEYETTGMFGSNLGVFDPAAIARWNSICGRLGIDTISAGSAIAWAMEATEKGIMNSDLKFGSGENIERALTDIGTGTGSYRELGRGVKWLSEKYGGKEFAIHVKGLEAAAYDPRGAVGHGLGLATANRGACHLEASMMAVQAFEGFSFRHLKAGVAYQVAWFENLFAAINNLETCQLTSNSVVGERLIVRILPRWIIRVVNLVAPAIALGMIDLSQYHKLWSSITGISLTRREFLECGARTHLLERYMNTLEGISINDDRLPERFTSEARKSDPENIKLDIEKSLRQYYRYRGYNPDGIPDHKILKKFMIFQFNKSYLP